MSNFCFGGVEQLSSQNSSSKRLSTVEASRDELDHRTSVNRLYVDDTELDSEEAPLFLAEKIGRRHQFEVDEFPSYFPKESVLKELFARKSRALRFKLYMAW